MADPLSLPSPLISTEGGGRGRSNRAEECGIEEGGSGSREEGDGWKEAEAEQKKVTMKGKEAVEKKMAAVKKKEERKGLKSR